MDITTLTSLVFFLLVVSQYYLVIKGFERSKRDVKVESRDPPTFSGVTLSGSYPQGTLVKVVTPNDPLFKSPWDGLTGVVVGVDELHEWYNVMFPLDGHMKFQVFRRHDIEKVDKA